MAQLPEKFRPYFWDTDFDSLDIRENRSFIISRLYTKGGLNGINWVEKTYSNEDIIYATKTRRDFHPIVANYLRKKYGLKKEEMNYYRMNSQKFWW